MDPELRSWTQRQDAVTQEIAADQKRQADALTIMAKELAAITNLLTPRISEGESPLEHLLAQLVAQGNEQLHLLRGLSRDSWLGQRNGHSLSVKVLDGVEDFAVEVLDVVEGPVGKVVGLQVAPDGLDVVEFGRVFGQPFDAQPMGAGGQRRARELAGVNGTVVLDQHDGRGAAPGLGAVEPVPLFEMGDEIAAGLGLGRMDDMFAGLVVE